MVRRILARHCLPGEDSDGPSWLTFLGHMKDSLWSIDLFRYESAMLLTHWVLVVMDQYPSTRVFGSYVVLDDSRSRKQAARFQDLL